MSKQSKHRFCPALGRTITSAECGGDCHRIIRCTADCPFNPFAPQNYDALLDSETDLDKRTLMALADEIGNDRVLKLIKGDGPEIDEVAGNAAIIRELFVRRDPQGLCFADRWLATSPRGLKNDDRLFLAAKARMRPVLLEVQEIRSDGLFRAVDLLEPEAGELLVLDRTTWSRAGRFQCLLVWTYTLPHFTRMCGAGLAWPTWHGTPVTPPEALNEIIAHLGGPGPNAPVAERRTWLAMHFEDIKKAVFAVSDARRLAMFEQLDTTFGWREFVLPEKESKALPRKLKTCPDAIPDTLDEDDRAAGMTSAWTWCERPSKEDPPGSRQVLGRLARSGTTWRIRGMNRDRLDRLQNAFLALAGAPKATPSREFLQNVSQQEANRIEPPDIRLVPPKLLEQPAQMQLSTSIAVDARAAETQAVSGPEATVFELEAAATARWVDEPIPGLDDRTPREAVRDPALRTRAIAMVKERIRDFDDACLRGQRRPDPMSIVRELGLHEIDVPAPPPRPLVSDPDDDDLDADANDAEDWSLPGPAFGPLSPEEAVDRVMLVQSRFVGEELLDAWDEEFPVLSDEVYDACIRRLTEDQSELVDYGVALAWFALGGMDTPSDHRFDPANLRLSFDDLWSRLKSIRDVDALLARSQTHGASQPMIFRATLAACAARNEFREQASLQTLIAIASWIEVLTGELARINFER